jgi:hypothetical protein|tara:strand:- start:654 stop:962 length:309 start_codon:yes stop_codon:yes gene_type:complete
MPKPVGILSLRDVRGVGLNPKHRFIMQDKLRGLFSNEWLDGLNDDQIYDLFEEYIDLPMGSHISYQKPPRETLNGNVISIYPIPHEKPWWEDLPKPDTEEEI